MDGRRPVTAHTTGGPPNTAEPVLRFRMYGAESMELWPPIAMRSGKAWDSAIMEMISLNDATV